MKFLSIKRARKRRRRGVYGGVDPHKWANKMEIHRLTSAKGDLRTKRQA
jgi:hypothetical protein